MPEEGSEPVITDEERDLLRSWLREWWENDLPFNRRCGVRVREWCPESVTLAMPFDADVAGHHGRMLGGMTAAFADSTAAAAVLAGHDFRRGYFPFTVSMTVNFLEAPTPDTGLVATGRCTRRSSRLNSVTVSVVDDRAVPVADALVAISVSGSPPQDGRSTITERIEAYRAGGGAGAPSARQARPRTSGA